MSARSWTWAAAAGLAALTWGCASDRPKASPPDAPQVQQPGEALDEHREKARAEIHSGNVDAELERLRSELGGGD